MTNSDLAKGMVAGFVATAVLSGIMALKSMMGVMPQFDMIGLLANMLGGSRLVGWVVHFLIGTLLWGGLFVWLDPHLPTDSHWIKGVVFGVAAWVPMMIIVMPMAGAGLFAVKLGMMVTAATFMLHAIFGAVMGAVYGAQRPDPAVRPQPLTR